jgi:predicted amidohydrolase YtcJ
MALAADLVLYNGKIVTVDRAFSVVEAVAARDGRLVAVGGNDEVRRLAGSGTRVVDLGGRFVVPAFMDNHVHGLLAGLDAPEVGAKVNIATSQSIAEILAAIGRRARETPPGEWIGTSCMPATSAPSSSSATSG